jgi:hypothetical protein
MSAGSSLAGLISILDQFEEVLLDFVGNFDEFCTLAHDVDLFDSTSGVDVVLDGVPLVVLND